ncbi:MAG: acyl carrier protein [Deltaproteobacteria bacterium RBG_13_65_10]|nr:MAG: acyl carrier protein [Deltaproteobacteria bacterium RBG_13_65_10]
MTLEEIQTRLKLVIEKKLHVNQGFIQDEAKIIDDLGADSLAVIELVMAVEDEFTIHIPDRDAERLATVGEVVRYIDKACGGLDA